jgi:hypothetical protein
MPMTAAGMLAKMILEMGVADDAALQTATLTPLAKAIVEYIQQNALVSTTGSATAQTGTVS